LAAVRTGEEQRLAQLTEQWDQERAIINQIGELRLKLEEAARSNGGKGFQRAETPDSVRQELARLNDRLAQVQGRQPLMHSCVTAQTVAAVISGWTGIPVGKMQTDEINAVLSLKEKLEGRVVGQPHALEAIAQRIRTARANLTDPRRPIGVFLLVG